MWTYIYTLDSADARTARTVGWLVLVLRLAFNLCANARNVINIDKFVRNKHINLDEQTKHINSIHIVDAHYTTEISRTTKLCSVRELLRRFSRASRAGIFCRDKLPLGSVKCISVGLCAFVGRGSGYCASPVLPPQHLFAKYSLRAHSAREHTFSFDRFNAVHWMENAVYHIASNIYVFWRRDSIVLLWWVMCGRIFTYTLYIYMCTWRSSLLFRYIVYRARRESGVIWHVNDTLLPRTIWSARGLLYLNAPAHVVCQARHYTCIYEWQIHSVYIYDRQRCECLETDGPSTIIPFAFMQLSFENLI